MWWGGFSEHLMTSTTMLGYGLNPHVVGRFFRGDYADKGAVKLVKS